MGWTSTFVSYLLALIMEIRPVQLLHSTPHTPVTMRWSPTHIVRCVCIIHVITTHSAVWNNSHTKLPLLLSIRKLIHPLLLSIRKLIHPRLLIRYKLFRLLFVCLYVSLSLCSCRHCQKMYMVSLFVALLELQGNVSDQWPTQWVVATVIVHYVCVCVCVNQSVLSRSCLGRSDSPVSPAYRQEQLPSHSCLDRSNSPVTPAQAGRLPSHSCPGRGDSPVTPA